jgi:hypothetical protein
MKFIKQRLAGFFIFEKWQFKAGNKKPPLVFAKSGFSLNVGDSLPFV